VFCDARRPGLDQTALSLTPCRNIPRLGDTAATGRMQKSETNGRVVGEFSWFVQAGLLKTRSRSPGRSCFYFWRPMKVKGFGRRIFGIGWAAGGSRRTVELVSGEHGWSAMMFRHRFRLNLRSGLVGGVASVVVSG
jgi:hypothetical protein